VPPTAHLAPPELRTPSGILIRSLVAADRHAVSFLLQHLSKRSRYLRYFGPNPNLVSEVRRLTATDHWHHEALIAFSPAPRTPIGVAEYVRLHDFDVAELALAVVDDWQRRGVGRALLQTLRTRALAAGIRRLALSVLPDNSAMLGLARKIGPLTALETYDDLVELFMEL
jgi:RimJ/RimL family protein N-acetyltransferase